MTTAEQPTTPVKERAINMTVYLLPDDHRRLKILAAQTDSSLQALILDGIDLVFQRHGEAPVTRWQPRRKPRQA